MNRKWANGTVAALLLALVTATGARGQSPVPPEPNGTGAAAPAAKAPAAAKDQDAPELVATALSRAAKANKYVFVLAYRADDEPTQAARKTLDAAMKKFADRALTVTVDVTDPLEQQFVMTRGLDRAPLPLVLAIAPTGAVTRGFPGKFTEAQLESAFVSPGMQRCLKALQDRKLAFVCVQNDNTQHNAEAMQGVKDFVADAQYAKTTVIITVDPADAAEESLLKQFRVDPKTEEAVTVFLAPPGALVGTYKGETKKDVLVAAAKTAAKGCDPKSGCCPAPAKRTTTQPAQPQALPPRNPEKKP